MVDMAASKEEESPDGLASLLSLIFFLYLEIYVLIKKSHRAMQLILTFDRMLKSNCLFYKEQTLMFE